MNSGVYKITIGNMFYFGSSCRLKNRERTHILSLERKTHRNIIMQRCYDKYKEFNFEIISLHDKDVIRKEEQKLLDLYKGNRNCMNISFDAISFQRTPEGLEKLIALNKSRVWTKEQREALASKRRGTKWDTIALAKRSQKQSGVNNPNSKLTTNDIESILEQRKNGVQIKSLAEKFGVDRTTITNTCSKHGVFYKPKTWSEAMRKAQKEATIRNPKRYSRDMSKAKRRTR